MNHRYNAHLFWGSQSPLSAFAGAGLIIMASSRFAFALVCAGALIWVYGLTALVFSGARDLLPGRGRMLILLFLSAFFSGLFMLLVSLFNPLLSFGTYFFLVLIPASCLGTRLFEESERVDSFDVFSRAVSEAAVMAGVILAFALIREPLGIGTLSFPGGAQGIIEIIDSRESDAFFPIGILSASAGGLFLFGYATALFRYFREQSGAVPPGESEERK